MKSFIFKEIMILSKLERTAKMVSFHPVRTVILGKNDTGKSSLIKSIYAALGASAAKENAKWKAISPTLLLKFSLSGLNYTILKDGNYFTVFDQNDQLIKSFNEITKGLGPFLANIFNFRLKLTDQQGKLIIPPPAFCFLPYYIDQDVSWQQTWASFKNLQQIKAYRKPVIEYHTGLRPDDYYETKSESEGLQQKIDELEKERKLSKKVLEKIKGRLTEDTFDINLETFQEEVKALLVQCQQLKQQQEHHKSRLLNHYNSKVLIESQIIIAEKAVHELEKDFQYSSFAEDEVECPTCGAHYDNSFSERFNIAVDERRTVDLMHELRDELILVLEKIKSEEGKFHSTSGEIERIEAILEEKKGEIKLKDVIEKEGKRELNIIFDEDIRELERQIFENAEEKYILTIKLAQLEDKERKENIRSFYKGRMKLNLKDLDVINLSESDYADFTKNINNTGSTGVRLLIAYYFAIYQLMEKFNTNLSCPIVIDSPNQQAQDQGHVDKIYEFIKNNQPKNSQMILGLEELYNVNFDAKIIELKDKYHLLNSEDYDVVYDQVSFYLNQSYRSDLFS